MNLFQPMHYDQYVKQIKATLVLAVIFMNWGCTRFDLLNATIPSWGYEKTRDIAYGAESRQKLDVYRPNGSKQDAPVVIFFYGGDWQTGSRQDYRFAAQALSSKGFVTVMPDYRLYPQVTFPTFIDDAAMAVRWVNQNIARFGGDPKRIHLMGHSAGAHIVALLHFDERYLRRVGLDRSAIRASAMLSGPYDFVPSEPDLAVFNMTSLNQIPDPDMEPIHFADGSAPPALLITGLADQTVDPSNTTRLADKIRIAGGEVTVITYLRTGHVPVVLSLALPFRWLTPALNDTVAYFKKIDRASSMTQATLSATQGELLSDTAARGK